MEINIMSTLPILGLLALIIAVVFMFTSARKPADPYHLIQYLTIEQQAAGWIQWFPGDPVPEGIGNVIYYDGTSSMETNQLQHHPFNAAVPLETYNPATQSRWIKGYKYYDQL